MDLPARFKAGDFLALARFLTLVENRVDGYQDLLAGLYADSGRALRVGITGPPGAGKSTLVYRLAQQLSAAQKKIGIIAVDPTSPFTGGALLGDRIRMQELAADPHIFIRSMATRGSTGGLAEATRDATLVLDAFGKEIILIETVGVGQVELDIAQACDTVIVVFVPESGDAVQAMKAGLMEIADIFCLNKADREGADRLVLELQSVLGLRQQRDQWENPIIQTQAINNMGTADLWTAVEQHREFRGGQATRETRQQQRIADDLLTIIRGKVDRHLQEVLTASAGFREAVEQVYQRQANPYAAADQLLAEISDSLAG